jgi:hypothetical protein
MTVSKYLLRGSQHEKDPVVPTTGQQKTDLTQITNAHSD